MCAMVRVSEFRCVNVCVSGVSVHKYVLVRVCVFVWWCDCVSGCESVCVGVCVSVRGCV